jgi:uncharacterized protein
VNAVTDVTACEPPPAIRNTSAGPIPARAGIGLRAAHHAELAAGCANLGWLEAHSENYFGEASPALEALMRARAHYPASLHGVGLSIGSTDPLSANHLRALRELIARVEPALVSEHLCWSSVGGRFTNDLLPLPYTSEALQHMILRVGQVQDALGRQILIENVSSYLRFAHEDLTEWDFLAALASGSGCGVLLDVNNVYVNSCNHGFDPLVFLNAIPLASVREIHLAGHSTRVIDGRQVLIDTHNAPVAAPVWELYREALRRFGAVPTLIEWDADLPPLEVLQGEAEKADEVVRSSHAAAA